MKNKFAAKKLLGIILTIAYNILMLVALFSSSIGILSSALIVTGCALNFTYVLTMRRGNYYWFIILGMLCISVSAVINGIQQSDLNISHHVIRTMFEGLIIVLFMV